MKPGAVLHRMARVTCTSDRYERVLEPALADLQHEWNGSRSRSALLRNYAAFWQSWGACILRDATSCESRSFDGAALTAFALTIAVAWLMEFALMHASLASHRLMRHVPYIGFYAMFDTATWRYGVPLAMGPALFYAASRTIRDVPAAHLTTIALGALFTVISSGWIAPELIRRDLTRQHDAFARWAAHAPSSSINGIYVPPLDFSQFQEAKPWPELIRSATEPPRHPSSLMPWYVAPGEEKRPAADRQEIMDRLFLVLLAFGSGVAGGTIRGSTRGHASVPRSA